MIWQMRRVRRTRRIAVVLLIIFCLIGGIFVVTQGPAIQVGKTSIEEISLGEATFATTLTFTNPNPYEIRIEKTVITFRLNNIVIGKSESNNVIRLPAKESSDVVIKISISPDVLESIKNQFDATSVNPEGIDFTIDGTTSLRVLRILPKDVEFQISKSITSSDLFGDAGNFSGGVLKGDEEVRVDVIDEPKEQVDYFSLIFYSVSIIAVAVVVALFFINKKKDCQDSGYEYDEYSGKCDIDEK